MLKSIAVSPNKFFLTASLWLQQLLMLSSVNFQKKTVFNNQLLLDYKYGGRAGFEPAFVLSNFFYYIFCSPYFIL